MASDNPYAMFTGAKLAKAISWSWWLVFSPAIIYWGTGAVILLLAWIVIIIYWLVEFFRFLVKKRGTEKCKFKA
ncbi:hypothetical protein L2724_07015 [Limosilactobacillus vaginalis]|uniref:DUF3329 domain-containing protein n=1 Tax=Limosilactobacillus vaginalis TaxID=1633 RepID=A0AAW5WUP7_9LACO|nr:hypothetical protein [Limosilactobacillus vaginalis]MCZ3668030.1 hypothetical protein [Limosilactobacillus vaginalis]